jgi:hypothetical protein
MLPLPNLDYHQTVAARRRVANRTVQIAIKYHLAAPRMVVGVDLSGDPNRGDATDFFPALR